MALPTPKKQEPPKWDFQDALIILGLGLLGYAFFRVWGITALVFYAAFLCLTYTKMTLLAVQFCEFHLVNTVRGIFWKPEKPEDLTQKVE